MSAPWPSSRWKPNLLIQDCKSLMVRRTCGQPAIPWVERSRAATAESRINKNQRPSMRHGSGGDVIHRAPLVVNRVETATVTSPRTRSPCESTPASRRKGGRHRKQLARRDTPVSPSKAGPIRLLALRRGTDPCWMPKDQAHACCRSTRARSLLVSYAVEILGRADEDLVSHHRGRSERVVFQPIHG